MTDEQYIACEDEEYWMEEYERCLLDPVYFARKYMRIVSDDGLKTTMLFDVDKQIIRWFARQHFTGRHVTFLKGRRGNILL